MGHQAYPVRGTQPELTAHIVRMVGTGASAPTKTYGDGITITRTSEGLYKLTWGSNPGTFLMWSASLGADTPSAVAGFTLSRDTYTRDATTGVCSMEFLLSEADNSVVDLQALQYIDLILWFRAV